MKKKSLKKPLGKFVACQLNISQVNNIKGGTGTDPEDIPSIVVVDTIIL